MILVLHDIANNSPQKIAHGLLLIEPYLKNISG